MNCPKCGTEMVPMIMSSFCPRDCDRPVGPKDVVFDAPWARYDTGNAIAVKGKEGGSYHVYHYTFDDIRADAPFPPSSENLRGWWMEEGEESRKSALGYLIGVANRGFVPGWVFNETKEYIRSQVRANTMSKLIVGVLVFAWVEG